MIEVIVAFALGAVLTLLTVVVTAHTCVKLFFKEPIVGKNEPAIVINQDSDKEIARDKKELEDSLVDSLFNGIPKDES